MRDDRYAALIALVLRPVGDPASGVVVEKVLDEKDCAAWVYRRRAKQSVHIENDMAALASALADV
jgi:hypothetical protein